MKFVYYAYNPRKIGIVLTHEEAKHYELSANEFEDDLDKEHPTLALNPSEKIPVLWQDGKVTLNIPHMLQDFELHIESERKKAANHEKRLSDFQAKLPQLVKQ